MTLETEVAALTTATTSLLNAVNVSKAVLESSKNAAISSADSALASLNDLKGRYYGPLIVNPTLDPLGIACGVGDLYFNTTNQVMMVFNTLGKWQNYEANAVGSASSAANSAAQAQGSQVTASAASVSAAVASASAASSATTAVASATNAAMSAQAAAAAANMYASTALGLAATTPGGYFTVPAPGADSLFSGLYRNDTGVATLIASVYNTAKVDALEWTQAGNCLAQADALVRLQSCMALIAALS